MVECIEVECWCCERLTEVPAGMNKRTCTHCGAQWTENTAFQERIDDETLKARNQQRGGTRARFFRIAGGLPRDTFDDFIDHAGTDLPSPA